LDQVANVAEKKGVSANAPAELMRFFEAGKKQHEVNSSLQKFIKESVKRSLVVLHRGSGLGGFPIEGARLQEEDSTYACLNGKFVFDWVKGEGLDIPPNTFGFRGPLLYAKSIKSALVISKAVTRIQQQNAEKKIKLIKGDRGRRKTQYVPKVSPRNN